MNQKMIESQAKSQLFGTTVQKCRFRKGLDLASFSNKLSIFLGPPGAAVPPAPSALLFFIRSLLPPRHLPPAAGVDAAPPPSSSSFSPSAPRPAWRLATDGRHYGPARRSLPCDTPRPVRRPATNGRHSAPRGRDPLSFDPAAQLAPTKPGKAACGPLPAQSALAARCSTPQCAKHLRL